jgi:hypothetical protein
MTFARRVFLLALLPALLGLISARPSFASSGFDCPIILTSATVTPPQPWPTPIVVCTVNLQSGWNSVFVDWSPEALAFAEIKVTDSSGGLLLDAWCETIPTGQCGMHDTVVPVREFGTDHLNSYFDLLYHLDGAAQMQFIVQPQAIGACIESCDVVWLGAGRLDAFGSTGF